MFKNLPYKFPVIGYKEQFSKLSREELLAYYHRTYIPNNMILVVVGDFKAQDIAKHIHKRFNRHQQKPINFPQFEEDEPWEERDGGDKPPQGPVPAGHFSWQTVSYFDKEMYPLDVLASMLGGGPGSILHTRLKEKEKLVENIHAFSWTPKYRGIFEIAVDLSPTEDKGEISNKIVKIEAIIQEELESLRRGKIEAFRLNTVKRSVLTSAIRSKESALGTAQSLAGSVMTSGSFRYDEVYLQGIEKVTQRNVVKMAKAYFPPESMKRILMVSEALHQQGPVFPQPTLDKDIPRQGIDFAEYITNASLANIIAIPNIKKTAISYQEAITELEHLAEVAPPKTFLNNLNLKS